MTPRVNANRYDLLVIGGGINGAGIARDAAGRGLKVLLVERGDLAGATSSASTKLIHGGLRYLEHYEFRLVSEALTEREVLMRAAPHIIWPLEFVLPHEPHLRPGWMIRTGLWLYDRLGGESKLPRSRSVRLSPAGFGAGLKPEFTRGFVYADGWVDDARLVMLNARSAADHRAEILTRTEFLSARADGDGWLAAIRPPGDVENGVGAQTVSARAIVNAAGPWVKQVMERRLGQTPRGNVRHVKGSHIVVPRLHQQRHAFLLQNPDRRIVFVIPYERDFTLIGTTDVPVTARDLDTGITPQEIAYLCEAASRYTARPITPESVVWSYSGVRPLYDDGTDDPSSVTRDYHFELSESGPPLLSVFGGKITTYRRLAEAALELLAPVFGETKAWTRDAPLPGGDFADQGFDALFAELCERHPHLPGLLLARLTRRHGTLAGRVIEGAVSEADLGRDFGGGLYEAEVRWLIAHEWAREPDDILWRRTKCGLHMSAIQRQQFADAMKDLT